MTFNSRTLSSDACTAKYNYQSLMYFAVAKLRIYIRTLGTGKKTSHSAEGPQLEVECIMIFPNCVFPSPLTGKSCMMTLVLCGFCNELWLVHGNETHFYSMNFQIFLQCARRIFCFINLCSTDM